MEDELVGVARRWIDADPDPVTAASGEAILASGDAELIRAHFGRRLTFGTAGIRGPVGVGPARMNRALVRRVTAGLVAALARDGAGSGLLVIGFDGRADSESFAEDAARVAGGAGMRVLRFARVCPTPVLAYAVRALRASGGVMITASHNPATDNGYKIYGPDGAQVGPDLEDQISREIDAAADQFVHPTPSVREFVHPTPSVREFVHPTPSVREFVHPTPSVREFVHPTPSVREFLGDPGGRVPGWCIDQYVADVLAIRVHASKPDLRIVYTAMHGVGTATVRRVFAEADYESVFEVAEQAAPDPAFPTVPSPNPEEPGALDLALALAARVGADLVLANDPDADRIAVAIPTAATTATAAGWRQLNGNEIGTLLAEDLLANGQGGDRLVATTVVSSTLLRKIAEAHGAEHTLTLTGFKWIARAAIGSAARFVLGYEEALGVCAGDLVRDKDGISAAVLIADLASALAFAGRTLADALDDLSVRHGVHLTSQITFTRDPDHNAAQMTELRSSPWTTLAGVSVTSVTDYAAGASGLPSTDLLEFRLNDGSRVLLRPSGTEPKLKCYLEVVQAVGPDGLAPAKSRAAERLKTLEAEVRERVETL